MTHAGQHTNALGQPIGAPLPDSWAPPPRPVRAAMQGRFVRLEPLVVAHAEPLHEANSLDREGRLWTYMGYGPFETLDAYRRWVGEVTRDGDPMFYAIVGQDDGRPVGVASYLRITPASGAIEVGNICYSPLLQRTPGATETMYLMMRWAFEAGYRRYEWKCDALNAPSRRAAQRLGFSYEGVFRQATLYKGRNRDTAWYAVIDSEWPALQTAFETWLDPASFDAGGRQRESLSALTRPLLANIG
ncbi:MAG TPA: GNAT family protein [Thermohalobaculum sp.]|nr:GNAT family protein [Thermohalobaculum sp.]